jgi:hypothetical protein
MCACGIITFAIEHDDDGKVIAEAHSLLSAEPQTFYGKIPGWYVQSSSS